MKKHLIAKLLLFISAGASLLMALMYVVNPAHCVLLPPCLLHRFTGLYCPGCGSTRAIYELAHGHLGAAFRLNPLLLVLPPILGLWLVRTQGVVVKPVWIWTLLAVMIVFGVLRNLPWPPFVWLAPQP